MSMTLSEELAWRGFANQTTYKDMTELDGKPITFYWGVDPSASSMTIGNLAAAMMVKCFMRAGHKAVLLIGGATGLIGDPDGKAEERTLKSLDEIAVNKEALVAQYKQVFDGLAFDVVDNYDWFKDMGYLQFLRDIGKHVPMRQMLSRDFVQTRLSEHGAGISYAEFSYVLIQAFDFVYLNQERGVTLQLCGSDQWGNSIAGVDLIRRLNGHEAHVWSTPLVVNKATGQKFGKSEAGAIWLDPKLTSPYQFYQFWLNADDEGVIDYLKIYTTLSFDELSAIAEESQQAPERRTAQKILAFEVTKTVHGQDWAERVRRATEVSFSTDIREDDLAILNGEIPALAAKGQLSLVELIVGTGLASSKSEAKRFIEEGAIYVNNTQTTDSHLTEDQFIGRYVLLRRGKNKLALIER